MYNSFHLSNFLYFHNLFDNFLNGHDLWDFNNTVNNLLDNFLHFNYFRDYSEYLQNIINIDNSHDLLVNHANNSLIDLESSSSFSF